MLLGTTYSHHYARQLGLDHPLGLEEVLTCRFDLLRLGVYWSEVQPAPGTFDLSSLTTMLDQCEAVSQPVVLTIGMKAPRWPEFYLPNWLATSPRLAFPWVMAFIERAVLALRHYRCIAYWQVENEPLDLLWGVWKSVPLAILRQEVALVRRLDNRPIHLNTFALWPDLRGSWVPLQELGDTMGLDMYYKAAIPGLPWGYLPLKDADSLLHTLIQHATKPVWITELQAEPWERRVIPSTAQTPSMNPHILAHHVERARRLRPAALLWWGIEYWLQQKQRGNPSMWDAALHHTQELRDQA